MGNQLTSYGCCGWCRVESRQRQLGSDEEKEERGSWRTCPSAWPSPSRRTTPSFSGGALFRCLAIATLAPATATVLPLPLLLPGASHTPKLLQVSGLLARVDVDALPSERLPYQRPSQERDRASAATPISSVFRSSSSSSSSSVAQPQLISFYFTKALAREEELLLATQSSCWFILPSYLLATPHIYTFHFPPSALLHRICTLCPFSSAV